MRERERDRKRERDRERRISKVVFCTYRRDIHLSSQRNREEGGEEGGFRNIEPGRKGIETKKGDMIEDNKDRFTI